MIESRRRPARKRTRRHAAVDRGRDRRDPDAEPGVADRLRVGDPLPRRDRDRDRSPEDGEPLEGRGEVLRLRVAEVVLGVRAALRRRGAPRARRAAARRLTTDSTASERRPTDPVRVHADVFRPIVAIGRADGEERVTLGAAARAAGVDPSSSGGEVTPRRGPGRTMSADAGEEDRRAEEEGRPQRRPLEEPRPEVRQGRVQEDEGGGLAGREPLQRPEEGDPREERAGDREVERRAEGAGARDEGPQPSRGGRKRGAGGSRRRGARRTCRPDRPPAGSVRPMTV